jgi:uncharacterized membrane protein
MREVALVGLLLGAGYIGVKLYTRLRFLRRTSRPNNLYDINMANRAFVVGFSLVAMLIFLVGASIVTQSRLLSLLILFIGAPSALFGVILVVWSWNRSQKLGD